MVHASSPPMDRRPSEVCTNKWRHIDGKNMLIGELWISGVMYYVLCLIVD